jgi:uncharacterized membrane protein YeaQ/YmgE (transglycosylase-associated protein family)
MFADVILAPGNGGFLVWLLVGLIAGWLTGLVMQGTGYGLLRDTILGLIGAFIGGLIFNAFDNGVYGFWGSVGVAFIGACVLVFIVRLIAPARRSPWWR